MADSITKETIESLHKMLETKREGLRTFRFEGAGSRRRNVREARTIRKEIARILTELQARKVAGSAK